VQLHSIVENLKENAEAILEWNSQYLRNVSDQRKDFTDFLNLLINNYDDSAKKYSE